MHCHFEGYNYCPKGMKTVHVDVFVLSKKKKKKVTTVQKAVKLQCHVPEECFHRVFGPGTSLVVSAALHITMLPQRVRLPVCPVDPEHNSFNLARINVNA